MNPTVRATRYSVTCLPEDHPDLRHFTLTVEHRGADRWAVMDHPYALDIHGNHHHDPGGTHRFDLDTAMRIAKQHAQTMTVNGSTPAQILARTEGETP